MQQWGGISNYSSHPEVREFIEDLKIVQNQMPDGRIHQAYFRPIEDPSLAFAMCYGDRSDKNNDCDMIIASRSPITIENGYFTGTNIFYSPEIPDGDWEPTFWATYRKQRGASSGLHDIRVGVYPRFWGLKRERSPLPSRHGGIR